MIELVIIACVIGQECVHIPLTTTFPSETACNLGAQMLLPALMAQHPEWWVAGWVCRVVEEDT